MIIHRNLYIAMASALFVDFNANQLNTSVAIPSDTTFDQEVAMDELLYNTYLGYDIDALTQEDNVENTAHMNCSVKADAPCYDLLSVPVIDTAKRQALTHYKCVPQTEDTDCVMPIVVVYLNADCIDDMGELSLEPHLGRETAQTTKAFKEVYRKTVHALDQIDNHLDNYTNTCFEITDQGIVYDEYIMLKLSEVVDYTDQQLDTVFRSLETAENVECALLVPINTVQKIAQRVGTDATLNMPRITVTDRGETFVYVIIPFEDQKSAIKHFHTVARNRFNRVVTICNDFKLFLTKLNGDLYQDRNDLRKLCLLEPCNTERQKKKFLETAPSAYKERRKVMHQTFNQAARQTLAVHEYEFSVDKPYVASIG